MKTIKHFISLAGLTGGLMTAAIPANILAQDAAVGESTKAAEAQAPAAPAPAASQEQTALPATTAPSQSQDQTPQPATTTTAQQDTNATATTQPTTAAAQDTSTNNTAEFSPDKGMRLNFRDVPLETVLNYMSKAAGYVIHPRVPISGRVNVWSDHPLSKDEAVDLLKHVLTDNGYTIIQDGRMLTIISSGEAKRNEIPVIKFRSVEDIPRNTDVATYIIPVHTLNPIALVKNLQPLTSSDTDLQANESANSLLLTDTQINVRRIAEIVAALDSVSSSINSIKVYPLKYADAKALASLVKELFPTSTGGAAGGGGNFGRFGGGGGGRGGGGRGGGNAAGFPNFAQIFGGGGNQEPTGSTPSSRVAAVSDDHSNSLIISAPEELIATVDELIEKVDQPVEDITVVKMIHLKNADPGETADLLASLFPDDTASGNQSQLQFGNRGGRGGRGGAAGGFGGFGGRGGGTSAASEYMKKMGRVAAVPDRRTQSIIVSASKDLMPQIEEMISQLDEIDSNSMKVHVYSLKNADPIDVQTLLQDLFPSSTTSRTTSLQNNPLQNRANTVLNNQMTSGAGSGLTSGFSSGGGGGRTGF